MKKISYNQLLHSLFFITILFFATACTSDKKTEKVEEEKGPFEVSVRLRAEPDRLSPFQALNAHTLQVVTKLFPPLLNYDHFTLKLSPVLAKTLPIKEVLQPGEYDGDATHKYTFEILDEAVWDNGQPVLASDYLFSLKALFNPHVPAGAPYRGGLDFIKDLKIDSTNPKKFAVYTKGTFRADRGVGYCIIPEHVYDPEGTMKSFNLKDLTNAEQLKSIADDEAFKAFGKAFASPQYTRETVESCGPYKLTTWNTGQELVLEKKTNWWGEKLLDKHPMFTANPDKLIYKFMADETATVAALKDGQLDIAGTLSANAFLDFKESNLADQFNFHTPETPLLMYMGLNNKRPKFSDKRVRRAIAHLVDVDKICEVVQRGFGKPAITTIDEKSDAFDKDLKRILYNVEQAKTLLAEAGWKDSNGDGVVDKVVNGKKEEMIIQILSTGSAISKPLISIISEGAIKGGVKVEERVIDGRSLLNEAMAKRDMDAWVSAFKFDADDFDPYQLWHTDSDVPNGMNRFGFGNAESDKMIEELKTTNDDVRRGQLYLDFQKLIYDEQPFVTLYYTKDRVIANKKLKNVETTYGQFSFYENYFER